MKTTSSVVLSLLTAAACAGGDDSDAFDQDAAAAAQDGKADAPTTFVRLERATPTQVAAEMKDYWGNALGACFTLYANAHDPGATKVTVQAAKQFVDLVASDGSGPCAESSALEHVVESVLEANHLDSATPAAIAAKLPAWAKPQLQAATVGGYVDTKHLDLDWYSDLMRVRESNARAQEKNPTGITLGAIRDAWDDVRSDTTLDRAYLNPVTFPAGALDGDQIFSYLRAAFPLRGLTLQSTGVGAINDFAAAGEGPAGDPAFKPIATALKKPSIKKRFYFARTGEWSSNVLIVIDNLGQAWGMQMGYSE